MRQFQSMTRSGEARDFNLIQDNSAYVQNWSIAQALVVILCTAVQVTQTHCITLKYVSHYITLHYIAAEIYDDSTEMCVRLLSGGQWLHYYTEVPDGCIICVSDFYLVPSTRLVPVVAARKWSSDSLLRWTVQ